MAPLMVSPLIRWSDWARLGSPRRSQVQTVSRADFDAGETYLTLMERNYEALRKGLNE